MYRKITIIILLGLLSGCMAKLSYSFADWIIEWTVTDYVSLDKAQKKQLRLDIDSKLEWHKQTQIIPYRDCLIEFREQAQRGLTRQWLLAWSEQLTQFWQDAVLEITPEAIAFLISLSDQQIEEMIASIDKNQLELEEQYDKPDVQKRLQERQQRAEDFIGRLIGKLNDQQKALIADWSKLSAGSTALWLQNRAQWTRQFEQVLLTRNSEKFADEITQLFVYREQLWSESYKQSVQENFHSGIDLALAIEPTMSAKQREKLNKFLNKWIAVLDKLSK